MMPKWVHNVRARVGGVTGRVFVYMLLKTLKDLLTAILSAYFNSSHPTISHALIPGAQSLKSPMSLKFSVEVLTGAATREIYVVVALQCWVWPWVHTGTVGRLSAERSSSIVRAMAKRDVYISYIT
jgi:hypothetical protein